MGGKYFEVTSIFTDFREKFCRLCSRAHITSTRRGNFHYCRVFFRLVFIVISLYLLIPNDRDHRRYSSARIFRRLLREPEYSPAATEAPCSLLLSLANTDFSTVHRKRRRYRSEKREKPPWHTYTGAHLGRHERRKRLYDGR